MNRFTTPLASFSAPTSRRDAIKVGGLTVTLGALIAGCGSNRGGSEAAGRVGNAPPTTALPSYGPPDEAVFLRTASSLEYTAIEIYDRVQAAGYVPDEATEAIAAFVENHQAIADRMVELTIEVGGDPWTCANPWFIERLVDPVISSISNERVIQLDDGEEFRSELSEEQKQADVMNFAEAFENLAAASHQSLVSVTQYGPSRLAHAEAASLEARQAAELAIILWGPDGYIAPALFGEEPGEGAPAQYAIPSTFGQTAQIEIKAGPPDQNGVIEGFTLQTPAENSFIYAPLTCEA